MTNRTLNNKDETKRNTNEVRFQDGDARKGCSAESEKRMSGSNTAVLAK